MYVDNWNDILYYIINTISKIAKGKCLVVTYLKQNPEYIKIHISRMKIYFIKRSNILLSQLPFLELRPS